MLRLECRLVEHEFHLRGEVLHRRHFLMSPFTDLPTGEDLRDGEIQRADEAVNPLQIRFPEQIIGKRFMNPSF
jgi:hypothetical protein